MPLCDCKFFDRVLAPLCIAVVACVGGSLHAQDLQTLSHQSWSTEDGLPQNSIHSIAQTSDGYIWVGTEEGLARFDGLQFKVFDRQTDPVLKSSDICCLVPDGGNGLWIGTRDGLVHRTDAGFVWYGAQDGLPSSEIVGLSSAADGSLLVTTSMGSIQWPHADNSRADRGPNAAWSSTATEVEFHSPTGIRRWRTGAELPNGRVSVLSVDREGNAWVGLSSGVAVIDQATGFATVLQAMKGVPILWILEDADGDHWIGTESSGLHILRRLLFHQIPALADLPITSVTQTKDGAMWAGTRDNGLYRIRDGIVDQPVSNRLLTSPVILCLQPALDGDGRLWVGTPDGLNRIDARNGIRRITTSDGLPDDYTRSLAVSPDGSVWVGTRHGLDHIRGGQHSVLTSMDGLGGDLIGAMFVDPSSGNSRSDSTLWVATSGGLSRIERDGTIHNFTPLDGLTSPIVTALTTDGADRLWTATRDGMVSVFDRQRFRPLFKMDSKGGSEQTVQSLTFDRKGSLWIHMDRGIDRIRAIQIDRCLSHNPCELQGEWVSRYNRTDGLRNDEAAPTTLATPWLTAGGELWFPTRAGIAVANTPAVREADKAPPVAIEQLLVDDAIVDLRQSMPEISYGKRRLSIEYAGLDFVSPGGVLYRLRLDGFDKQWQPVGNRRAVTYTNLAPGTYTFHVQARTSDGDWAAADTALQFRILPPFYRRWWFIALAIVAVLALLAGLYLVRLRVLRHRFDAVLAERNRMAREIHDTLTQDLVSTCLQLDIVAQQLRSGHPERATEQVSKARRLVTEGLAEARQSIWELRSNESRETLPKRLANLVQREAFSALKPHLEVRGAYRPLKPQTEREILRLANEALVNVARHADAEQANLTLYYSTEALMLTVQDNGAGFDVDAASQEKGHFGLMGMRERASVVDGDLEIVSQKGEGTTVRLRVPLKAPGEERG
jgi:signal transduction histidine kinase/ligand-binding sensor domain-containing protein